MKVIKTSRIGKLYESFSTKPFTTLQAAGVLQIGYTNTYGFLKTMRDTGVLSSREGEKILGARGRPRALFTFTSSLEIVDA
jgi:hypothetical protein